MTPESTLDLTNEKDVIALMSSSRNADEWNANCDKVKRANRGYPSFWGSAILFGGVATKTKNSWSKP